MENQYDLIIIGAGPGGYEAAIRAKQLGLNTAVVERDRLGGVCLNWGCIPSKALIKAAEYHHFLNDKANDYGFTFENLTVDFPKVIAKSRDAADKLSKGVEFLFKKNKIELFTGFAKFKSKNTLDVLDQDGKVTNTINAKNIIVATGCRPRVIPGLEFDHERIINSTDAMLLKEVPKSMVIIGAGAIGIEFAYIYNAFGTEVTIVEMMDSILPIEDKDVTKELTRIFKKQKMKILTKSTVKSATNTGETVELVIETPTGEQTLTTDKALVAVGVQPNTANMSLEDIGVEMDRGYIKVDKSYRSSVADVFAIGDVNGPPWLAHVASREGINCVERIAGKKPLDIDYDSIPGCTYCQPQVASIGLTEDKAIEKGYELKIGKFPIRANGKSVAVGEIDGFVKIIFDAKYGELLGAHILSSEATEILGELGMAKGLEATPEAILNVTHAHPTQTEAIKEAVADALGEAINF